MVDTDGHAAAPCDLFVSTKGDDSNRGTSVTAPFKTLQVLNPRSSTRVE